MSGRFDLISFSEITGGLALFLYGMGLAVEGLGRASGHRLRALLTHLTGNRTLATMAGAAVTVGLQSSSATTVMLVGLADVGLVTVRQSIPVIVGAAIGTTFTVQIIAFDVARYGLFALCAGGVLSAASRRESHRAAGRFVMGFGFVFFGMHLMKQGAAPLAQAPAFAAVLARLARSAPLGLLAAALFTAVVQSSAATLAMAIAVAGAWAGEADADPLRLVAPFVLGANVGTCATALLASIRAGRRGRQIGLAHLLIKLIAAGALLPLLAPYARAAAALTAWMTGSPEPDVARQVANAHTLFALTAAVLVLPFVRPLSRLVGRLAPVPPPTGLAAIVRRPPAGEGSSLPEALAAARQETAAAARVLNEMFHLAGAALFDADERALVGLARRETRLDHSTATVEGLSRLPRATLSEEQSRERDALLETAHAMEFAGNAVRDGIGRAAQALAASGADLSVEGEAHLREFIEQVARGAPALAEILEGRGDPRAIAEGAPSIEQAFRRLRAAHIERMAKALPEEEQTTPLLMDAAASALQAYRWLVEAAHALQAAARSKGKD